MHSAAAIAATFIQNGHNLRGGARDRCWRTPANAVNHVIALRYSVLTPGAGRSVMRWITAFDGDEPEGRIVFDGFAFCSGIH